MSDAGPVVSEEAMAIHRDAVVVDLHADTSIPMRAWRYRITKRHRFHLPHHALFWHCDLPRFREGGVDGQFFGLVTMPRPERGCAKSALKQIARLRRVADEHPNELRMAHSAADLRSAHRDGQLAAFLGMEGAHHLEGDIANVERFAEAGVRYLGLAHFTTNAVAPAARGLGASNDAPLPALGREVIAEMRRVAMILDLAHVGRRAFLDAAPLARRPIIVSHTGVSGALPHWRNIDDEQLRAVASTDGVVGVIFAGNFLARRRRDRTVDALIAHMEHIRRVVGARHIALGSDFDGFVVPVRGLEHVGKLPIITERLLRQGWPEDDIRAVLGNNLLRVLEAHEA